MNRLDLLTETLTPLDTVITDNIHDFWAYDGCPLTPYVNGTRVLDRTSHLSDPDFGRVCAGLAVFIELLHFRTGREPLLWDTAARDEVLDFIDHDKPELMLLLDEVLR